MPNKPGEGQQGPVLSRGGRWSLLIATTLALLSTGIVAPAMPDIALAFESSLDRERIPRALVSLISLMSDTTGINFIIKFFVLSVPALFVVVGAPFFGFLSDSWGRRRLLAISLIGFAVAGASGYFVDTLTSLLAGRAILGLCIAGIKTCTVAMVGDYFQGEERQKFLGLQGSAMKLGGVLFLVLGGFLADISWRTPFLVYLLAFLVLPGVILYLSDVHTAHTKVKSDARIPWGPAAIVMATTFLASTSYFMILVQVPFFLDQAFESSRFQIGIASASGNIIAALVATRFYLFKARWSYPTMFSWVFLMLGTGFLIVSASSSYAAVVAGLAISGLGIGLIVPSQDSWMLAIAPVSRRGMATGLVATVMYLGQFMIPVLLLPVIDPGDPFYAFRFAGIVLWILAAAYLILPYIQRKLAEPQIVS